MGSLAFLSFLLTISLGLMWTCQGHDFYVGGSKGWVQNPSENYNHWAGRNRFQVNDSLVFSYKKGEDSVLVVNKEDYDQCNTKNPISNFSDGYSVFKFDRSGPFFFISGIQEKCQKGEKMIVVVLAVRHSHTPPISPSHTPPISPPPSVEAPSPSPSDSPGEKYAPSPSPTPSDSPGEKNAPAPSPKSSSAASSLLFSWTSRFYFVGVVVAFVFGSFVGPF
ncbi:early nodulin-like protein 2 [Cinnamomum micranthum f. kanehirae]|uniref:Early nodulin-like protein 2 n=1 Tax=Cinnamomum micranthum f. kanehirae TaxID=337451 RepID=A0A443Q312_9MAGN|nr:early nodulin-like protein 2 [Cinnamomum micranthum f. kanehirae]